MNRILLLIAVLLLLPAMGAEAAGYESQCLRQLAAQIEADYGVKVGQGSGHRISGLPITVQRNAQGEVCHIGFSLFSEAQQQADPSPAYHFVERYLLQLFVEKDAWMVGQMLKENKVKLTVAGASEGKLRDALIDVVPRLVGASRQRLTHEGSRCTVQWADADRPLLRISFPMNYELLWGMPKKEVEARFYTRLLHFVEQHSRRQDSIEIPLPAAADTLPCVEGNCYVQHGEWYMMPAVNSNRYFTRTAGGEWKALHSLSRPAESVQNFFTLAADPNLQAEVTQRLYGWKRQQFDVGLQQLIDFCRNEGCEVYFGVERLEGNRLQASVIMPQRQLNYNHLLYVEVDIRALRHPGRYSLKMELYAYVPTHNLHSLYPPKKK